MSNVINFEEFRKTKLKRELQAENIADDFFDSSYDAAAQTGCDAAHDFSQDVGVATSAQQVAIGALSFAVCELGKAATLEVIDEILEWYSVQTDDSEGDADDAG